MDRLYGDIGKLSSFTCRQIFFIQWGITSNLGSYVDDWKYSGSIEACQEEDRGKNQEPRTKN